MVCAACEHAGAENKKGNVEKAEALHKMCVFPQSCTCQHRVGEGHINREEGNEN